MVVLPNKIFRRHNKMKLISELIQPLARVNPYWWFQTSQRVESKFLQENVIEEELNSEFRIIKVGGHKYFFPAISNSTTCRMIISELLSPDHPHQYITSETSYGENDIVLDIGSCEGAFAAVAATKGAKVIVIEPSRANCALIRKLFNEWQLDQPEIHEILIGPDSATMQFWDDPVNPGASRIVPEQFESSYPVAMLPLDELWKREKWPRLDFIKIDAEGYDMEILKSGKQLLKSLKPKIAVTTYHNADHPKQVKEFLESIGYKTKFKGILNTGNFSLRTVMLHAWHA